MSTPGYTPSPKGDLHQLFADAADPQSAAAWLIEKLSKNPKICHVTVLLAEEGGGNSEWRVFGNSIHRGVLLFLVEQVREWIMHTQIKR